MGDAIEYSFLLSNSIRKKGALHGEVAFSNKKKNGRLLLPVQGYFF